MLPLVSIVTPSFNQAQFLEDALATVESQSYRDLEHIVVDGGSTDGSVALLRAGEARYPRMRWTSEPDEGQSDAINKGIASASGSIIGWLNSDDFYCPEAVRRAVNALEAQPDAVAVYGDAWLVNEQGRPRRLFQWIEDPDAARLREHHSYIAQPTVFMRRSALDAVGLLNPSLHWTMDWDLWIRLSRYGSMVRAPEALACMREYGSTKTGAGGLRRYREIVRLLRGHGVPITAASYRFYFLSIVLEAARWRLRDTSLGRRWLDRRDQAREERDSTIPSWWEHWPPNRGPRVH